MGEAEAPPYDGYYLNVFLIADKIIQYIKIVKQINELYPPF